MLVLSSLTALLNQLVTPPVLHTAILLTPQGHLVAYSSRAQPPLSEDSVRVIVGLTGEVWREGIKDGNEEDIGMAESEVGHSRSFPNRRRADEQAK